MTYTEKPKVVHKASGAVAIERRFEFMQPEETSEPTTIQISTNGNATVSFGAQYNIQDTKSKFAAFRPWHISAIACIAVGVLIIALGWTRTIYGFILIGLGLFLGAWASFVPSNGLLALILSGVAAICAICYAMVKYRPKD